MAFQSEYRGSTTGYGFGAYKRRPEDHTSKIKQKTEGLIRDSRTRAADAKANYVVQSSQLRADSARANANLAALKGIASIGGQLASGISKIDKLNQQAARQAELDAEREANEKFENDMLLQAQAGVFGPDTMAGDAVAASEDEDLQVQAESQGIAPVYNELQESGDDGVATQLNQRSAYNSPAQTIKRAMPTAVQDHAIWMNDQISKMQLAGMSNAEIEAELFKLNKQFMSTVEIPGGSGKARNRALVTMYKGIAANTATARSNMQSQQRKQDREVAKLNEQRNLSIAARQLTPQERWRQASEATANSGVNGRMGRDPIQKERAFVGLLNELENMEGGAAKIRAMYNVQSVPGLKGSEFGKDARFAPLIKEAAIRAEKKAIDRFNHEKNMDKMAIDKASRLYFDDPTPENRQKAVDLLQENGSSEALAVANQILGPGFNNSPALESEILERQARGEKISEEEWRGWVSQGLLSDKFLKENGPTSASSKAGKEASSLVNKMSSKSTFENLINESALRNGVNADHLKQYKAQIQLRAGMMQEEVRRRLTVWLSNGGKSEEAPAKVEQIVKEVAENAQYQINVNTKGTVGEIDKAKLFKADPAEVADAGQFTESTGGARALYNVSTDSLRDNNLEKPIDSTKDMLFTREQLRTETRNFIGGGKPSKRAVILSRKLGISTRQLYEDQLRGYNLPPMSALQTEIKRENIQNTTSSLQSRYKDYQSYGASPQAARALAGLPGATDGTLKGVTRTQQKTLDRIAKFESGKWGYNAMNQGGSHGGTVAYGSGSSADKLGKNLTDMSVGEVMQRQQDGQIWAAGRYQFIPSTLRERVQKLGIPQDAKFDAALQDYITLDYMRENPGAWIGPNQYDPGIQGAISEASAQPLPPPPWADPMASPEAVMTTIRNSNPRAYNIINNPNSSPSQIQAAIIDVFGRQAGRLARQSDAQLGTGDSRVVYTTGNLGYNSTGDHLDVKPVRPGGIYADKNLPMTRSELDDFVAVKTPKGLKPISQAMEVTTTDAGHRARGSHGIDFAAAPNREIVLTNGAKVVENWVDNSAKGQGSHRLLIELPDGRRYAFLHGTSTIAPSS